MVLAKGKILKEWYEYTQSINKAGYVLAGSIVLFFQGSIQRWSIAVSLAYTLYMVMLLQRQCPKNLNQPKSFFGKLKYLRDNFLLVIIALIVAMGIACEMDTMPFVLRDGICALLHRG